MFSEFIWRDTLDSFPDFESELEFQENVCALARRYGWLYYFTRDSTGSPPGFYDLVLLRGSKILFLELKMQDRIRTADQVAWGLAAERTCAEYYVFRPSDWTFIKHLLSGNGSV